MKTDMDKGTFGLGRAIQFLFGRNGQIPDDFLIDKVEATEDCARLYGAGGCLVVKVIGDCCSHSYFDKESLETLRGLVGQTLKGLEDREVGVKSLEYGDRQIIYALVITTDKGSESVTWRNDSNGYYAGWVEMTMEEKSP